MTKISCSIYMQIVAYLFLVKSNYLEVCVIIIIIARAWVELYGTHDTTTAII